MDRKYPRHYSVPVNYSTARGFPSDPYWGFADIMTLERGPAYYGEAEAHDLIEELNSVIACFEDSPIIQCDPIRGRRKRKNKKAEKRVMDIGFRLPREIPWKTGALVSPVGDGLTEFERALMILGDRVKCTRDYYTLDGQPCHTSAILDAVK